MDISFSNSPVSTLYIGSPIPLQLEESSADSEATPLRYPQCR